ncbi:thioredoxin domain-containing protein [Paenibacillus sp. FA6]|uniref:thioredoxin domain-containing protein n=1 Tax=Paenibacillus sp. FA6 TaxID=3413029 RepID=UPI003F657A86
MKPKKNANAIAMRKAEREQQRKLTQRIMWITGAGIIVLAILFLVLKPSPNESPNNNTVSFPYENLPVIGEPDAPVKIVEFGDFKCPSCQYFSQQFKPQLMKDFVDKGLVSFYYMNYLIIDPDKDSNTAALAAQSVYHQNNEEFWKYYHAIYDNQQDERTIWATPEFLVELARKENIAVDYELLAADIKNKTYQNEVDEHQKIATKNDVRSTPTVFINGSEFKAPKGLNYNDLAKAINDEIALQSAGQEEK